MRTAAMIADENETMVKPLTMVEVSQSKPALIIKVESPNVRIVTGNVKIIRIGLMIAFNIPKIKATTRAVYIEATATPGKYMPIRNMANALMIQRIRNIELSLMYLTGHIRKLGFAQQHK